MPKLKSLRGAVGSYGRVAAGGIVDVDETQAQKLLATKRFVQASESDIAAAQKAQKAALAIKVTGATPGFAPLPEKPQAIDRLQEMIERGVLTVDEARKFTALQIQLSPEEIQTMLRREADGATAQIDAAKADLQALSAELDEREAKIVERETDVAEREHAVVKVEGDAKARAEEDAMARAEADAKAKAEATAQDAKQHPDAPAKAEAGKKAGK